MRYFVCILFSIIGLTATGQNLDSIFQDLDKSIDDKPFYVRQKEEELQRIKILKNKGLKPIQKYHLNEGLIHIYQKYNLQEAIKLSDQNLTLAKTINDPDLIQASYIQLATLYSTSGKFIESKYILEHIDTKNITAKNLSAYYESYSKFYSQYLVMSYNEEYMRLTYAYRDSLLSTLPPESLKYRINHAEQLICADQTEQAETILLSLVDTLNPHDDAYAMANYLLAQLYEKRQDTPKIKAYYALSAMADIKNAIKENASIYNLALICYTEGDIEHAYKYAKSALDDAVAGDVRFRTSQNSEFFSIINQSYAEKEEEHKRNLQKSLLVSSLLLFLLAIALIYIYKQMKRVSKIKEELSITNRQLAELNTGISQKNELLNDQNIQLSEANRIKEEYIAHFFDLCSTYINKLESYRKTLNKTASEHRLDDLYKILKSNTIIENEIEELYRNFDTIFLNLYPTFVSDFNALLYENERITLKSGELLNAELRIYALIRLGINDSIKIAAFLRYSLSTIYNYRSKIRNKTDVSREVFEKMVMNIGLINPKKR